MKKLVKTIAVIFLLITLQSGCSEQDKTNEESKETTETIDNEKKQTPNQDQQKEKTDPQTEPTREEKIAALQELIPDGITSIPETIDDFAAFPPGRLIGLSSRDDKQEIVEHLEKLPDIEEADEEIIELYYLALLGLFAEDFPDPQTLIEEIKMASYGDPEMDDPRFQFKEQYNVEIILDASGSMAEKVGGKTKMEAAKEAIQSFADALPEQAHVALRVYGHKGSSKESDKELSCGSSELVYNLQPYDAGKLQTALNQFQPTGYTPIARSLQEAQKDLSGLSGEKNTNIIYLVSDGIETCDGNPVEVAKQLADSDITPIVNVIGFGVDGEGQQQLQAVAKAAGGRYVSITNQKELEEEFDRSEEMAKKWERWKTHSSLDASYTHTRRMISIDKFVLRWKNIAGHQHSRLFSAITTLYVKDIVAEKTINALKKMSWDHYYLAEKKADELGDFLHSLNDKTYKETIEAIKQKYNENVNSD
ncbi:MAG: VWA domain-containing protein [Brevibacillus sp.]|nr:VWA domain-containing protein [Brevibacillus sp.]